MTEQIKNIETVENTIKKVNKKKTKIVIVTIVAIIVAILVFYHMGFIPVGLSAKNPIGDYKEISMGEYIEEYPDLATMPNLDKIEKKGFKTTSSSEDVIQDYTQKLLDEGYSLKYEGIVNFDGKNFEVYGFLKGLTAVGILTTPVSEEENGYNSEVIYVTGNALDFQEIIKWYQSK